MKPIAIVLALLVASCNAFSPMFATRAVAGTRAVAKAKPVAKPKPVAKKPVATIAVKKAAPKPKPIVAVKKVAPKPKPVVAVKKVAPKPKPVAVVKKAAPKPKPAAAKKIAVKNPFAAVSLPKVAVKPKAKISIQGPKTTRVKKNIEYVYDDGLSELERKQRVTLPIFLTGSAKSQKDPTAIRPDLVEGTDEYYFSPYDTTLATLGAFVIISLIIKAGSPGL
jgi:type IV secretory pathway VirB10-like protein